MRNRTLSEAIEEANARFPYHFGQYHEGFFDTSVLFAQLRKTLGENAMPGVTMPERDRDGVWTVLRTDPAPAGRYKTGFTLFFRDEQDCAYARLLFGVIG